MFVIQWQFGRKRVLSPGSKNESTFISNLRSSHCYDFAAFPGPLSLADCPICAGAVQNRTVIWDMKIQGGTDGIQSGLSATRKLSMSGLRGSWHR
jgi:hypothetical protein